MSTISKRTPGISKLNVKLVRNGMCYVLSTRDVFNFANGPGWIGLFEFNHHKADLAYLSVLQEARNIAEDRSLNSTPSIKHVVQMFNTVVLPNCKLYDISSRNTKTQLRFAFYILKKPMFIATPSEQRSGDKNTIRTATDSLMSLTVQRLLRVVHVVFHRAPVSACQRRFCRDC